MKNIIYTNEEECYSFVFEMNDFVFEGILRNLLVVKYYNWSLKDNNYLSFNYFIYYKGDRSNLLYLSIFIFNNCFNSLLLRNLLDKLMLIVKPTMHHHAYHNQNYNYSSQCKFNISHVFLKLLFTSNVFIYIIITFRIHVYIFWRKIL